MNAQTEELRFLIDKLAGEIHAPETGLLFLKTFRDPSGSGFFTVWIIRNGANSFTLGVHGGVNNGSGFSRTVDTKIGELAHPSATVTITRNLMWDNYYFPEGHGTITVSLSTTGNLTINVSNPHGRISRSEQNYTHE